MATNSSQANGVSVNCSHRPRTPSVNTLSLTEYASNASPPSEESPISKAKKVIPAEYLLPNGYPDVSLDISEEQ